MRKTTPINRNNDFRRAYKSGKSFISSHFVLYFLKGQVKSSNRLGITATKKIGNAVQRNRARRLLKEAYRLLEPELKTGYFFVLVARSKILEASCPEVLRALQKTFCALNLVIRDEET